jgi:uncharacterized protein YecT (DUF1311 family)
VRARIWCGLLAGSLVLLQTPSACAEEEKEKPHTIDAAYEACTDKDPSTAGMLACAAEAETAWDRELNVAYRDLVGALKGKPLEALREAQRAWIAQRDKEHLLQDAIHGELQGTMWGPVMTDQRVSLVKTRALQLRAYKSFLDDGRP